MPSFSKKTKRKANHHQSPINHWQSLIKAITSNNQIDIAVIFCILIFSFYIWWPTRWLPYHWDSAGFIVDSARHLMSQHFWPLIGNNLAYAHPMLIPLILGVVWTYVQESILASHLLMLPILPVLLISTYYMGKKVKDHWLGASGALLVGMFPVVLAEYGVIYVDLPMAAFANASLALWLYNQKPLAAFFLSIAILTKIPAVVLVIPMVGYTLLTLPRSQWRSWQALSSIQWLGIPLATIGGWIAYHHYHMQWILMRPDQLAKAPVRNGEWLSQVIPFVFDITFVDQYRWMLLVIGIIGMILLVVTKQFSKLLAPPSLFLFLVVVICYAFFNYTYEYAARYSIFFLPSIVLICLYWGYSALENKRILVTATIFIGFHLALIWHPPIQPAEEYQFRYTKDLSYQDMIHLGQEAATFLSVNFPLAKIYGAFPENYQLSQPYQGYVDHPLDFYSCTNFQPSRLRTQIIYFHPYSPGQLNCSHLLNTNESSLLKRFDKNGKWIELYQITNPYSQPTDETHDNE